MTDLLNQQAAITELAKTNSNYANALSGQNPPSRPVPPEPSRRFPLPAAFLMYVVPLFLVVAWFSLVSGADQSDGKLLGEAISTGLTFLLVGAFSYGSGSHLRKDANPVPAPLLAPTPSTMSPVQIEFLKQYLGNEVIITLRYDIPVDFDKGPLHTLLSLEADEIIDRLIDQGESIFSKTDPEEQERLRANGHTKLDTDLIEYQLVPRFGRAVFESKVPVFRFKVLAKSPRSAAALEHDIEIGDIL